MGTGGKAAGAEDGYSHLLSKLRVGGFHLHVRHKPSCWDGYHSTEVQCLMCISRSRPVHPSDSYEHGSEHCCRPVHSSDSYEHGNEHCCRPVHPSDSYEHGNEHCCRLGGNIL
jgi:hypothetical protein